MSLEKITNEILGDANLEKDKLLKDAQAEADAIIGKAHEEAKQMIENAKKQGEEEKARILERRKVLSNVDRNKLILQMKQDILQETFEKAGVSYEDNKRELSSEVAKLLF